ncbi:glycosyltransferase family 4 protein [Streptomyces prunicolor]|uniref:glycosyltransferase family 4 protein n=1 Tax=Streptomyces prunicolor TaxID=67348 RepID=UPI0003791591|nr:glycosyltransferase family 4 protein [Streptomyces prunicolor]
MVGHGVRPTGYARILRSLLAGLHLRGYDVQHAAVNWPGPPPRTPWTTHNNPLPGDPYGLRSLPSLLDAVRPDTVVVLHDLWITAQHTALIRAHSPRTTVLAYCPLDGPVTRPELIAGLSDADLVIACTRFGSAQLSGLTNLTAPVVPHGVDLTAFHPPRRPRRHARRLLFPDRVDLDDAFVVLNANRHNLRKRLDLTLGGFALFAHDKPPHAKLYLHAGLDPNTLPDPSSYLALRRAGRLLTTDQDSAEFPHLTDQQLNLVYSACDVGLNTATAEGFGLVSFEHAATGAAQVMPAHPTCTELWPTGALLLPVGAPVTYSGDYIEHRAVTPSAVAEALDRLYTDRVALAEQSREAMGNATNPRYGWDTILDDWYRLLDDGPRD